MAERLSGGNSTKRKRATEGTVPNKKRRYASNQEARSIAAQTTGKAFGNGEIDVDKFVRAREFEIKALEDGMVRAKKSLSVRAFQSLPRDLRRRTASHNVKRVPKRLQPRAKKEMLEDNTPTIHAKTRKLSSHKRLRVENAKSIQKITDRIKARKEACKELKKKNKPIGPIKARIANVKKNMLQTPPVPKAKFRKRQINKSWLPTHIYHTKRAHMTPPREPLWRMAIPLMPTQKSFRPAHRAAGARGAIAWDMSYMSTIGLEGSEVAVVALFKNLGVASDFANSESWWSKKATRWLTGTRTWDGMIYEHKCWPHKPIAPVTILWQLQSPQGSDASANGRTDQATKRQHPAKRKAILRVHPSAFLQVWKECLKLAKLQKPIVMVEDLRFEIGSIDLMGPASTEALSAVLQPVKDSRPEGHEDDNSDHDVIWEKLLSMSNPAALPTKAILAFQVTDPRLRHPLRTTNHVSSSRQEQETLRLLAYWPPDRTSKPTTLLDRQARVSASRALPSQKAINRRKGLAAPGTYPAPSSTDPKIPVVLLASRASPNSTGGQGTWTLMLPWKCVLPVWYSLMFYPLSTGGTISFGGLEQKRQLAFEADAPWFPGDFPGTAAGMDWEHLQREKRKADWEKRPRSKKVNYETIDLGHGPKGEIGKGWACDWQRLIQRCRNENAAADETDSTSQMLFQLSKDEANGRLDLCRQANAGPHGESMPNHKLGQALATIKITMLSRGVPSTCARVYRLPTTNSGWRAKCLALTEVARCNNRTSSNKNNHNLKKASFDSPAHVRRKALAASLIAAPPPSRSKGTLAIEDNTETHAAFPPIPDETDLIGFVTTGNLNLALGKGQGVGSILLDRVLMQPLNNFQSTGENSEAQRRLCIVRDAGSTLGRLGKWNFV